MRTELIGLPMETPETGKGKSGINSEGPGNSSNAYGVVRTSDGNSRDRKGKSGINSGGCGNSSDVYGVDWASDENSGDREGAKRNELWRT